MTDFIRGLPIFILRNEIGKVFIILICKVRIYLYIDYSLISFYTRHCSKGIKQNLVLV